MPDRKTRLWTTEFVNESPGASPSQENLSTEFRTKTGREHLPGDTVAHLYVKGLWSQSAAGDSSAEELGIGIGFYPSAMDAIDFPSVLDHDGDWVLHDVRGFIEPTTLQTPLVPIQLAAVDIESRGQRTVPRGGSAYSLWFVTESFNGAPSSGSFEFRGAVTILWLLA